mmetsp:Transcript_35616/g.42891  ORF Transcript_35616/g.42891 Transcript_35616/m.42891 type:complete len:177 (+) Transcript_35616:339-869(+)|eukprot:CAMPEP_0197851908 /NCGR_PEP_ID=MMETSP1438-20131217/19210_1 /TAXON_ID=1461541 /ORGANISM="Pterosperma sp., Strain CCMP1384" /LENGTH=176 /DNA_ID=CAMNT_0043465703 /DNA_START=323 /DNA_END=853 /DNA_ORIENTATION=+
MQTSAPLRILFPLFLTVALLNQVQSEQGFNVGVGSSVTFQHEDFQEFDPAMEAVPKMAPASWIDLPLEPPFINMKSYQSVQYHIEADGYVSLRGWCVATDRAEMGDPVFYLPPAAWPGREETFAITFKGSERRIVIGTDGVARLGLDLYESKWIPLASLGFYNMQATEAAELLQLE